MTQTEINAVLLTACREALAILADERLDPQEAVDALEAAVAKAEGWEP